MREQQKQREGSTFLDQYHSDIGGRFKVEERETITGRVSPKPPPRLRACAVYALERRDYIRNLRPTKWVSGSGLHSSNPEPLMSALGHKRTSQGIS